MRENRRPQTGLSLIAATSMLAVIGMLMAAFGARMSQDTRIHLGERLGNDMSRVGDMVQTFVDTYAVELKNGFTAAPVNQSIDLPLKDSFGILTIIQGHKDDATTMTIDRTGLRRIVDLLDARGISVDPVTGGQYALRLTFSEPGPGGSPPQACTTRMLDPSGLSECAIDSLLYVTEPVAIRNNAADTLVINAALKRIGVGAGTSITPDVGTIRFPLDSAPSSSMSNPVQPHRAGIIAIRGNRGDQHRPYMQLAGGTMKGLIDMDRHDIDNIGDLTAKTLAAGDIAMEGNTISAKSDLRFKGEAITFGHLNSAAKVEVSRSGLHADKVEAKNVEVEKEITFKAADLPACDGHKLALNKDGTPHFCERGTWRTLKGEKGNPGRAGSNSVPTSMPPDVRYINAKKDFSFRMYSESRYSWDARYRGKQLQKELGKWSRCELQRTHHLDAIFVKVIPNLNKIWNISVTVPHDGVVARDASVTAVCFKTVLRVNRKETTLSDTVGEWLAVR